MCVSTVFLLLLGASTCCLSLPRHSVDDQPQPVLPESLRKVVEIDDTVELRADGKTPSITITDVASATVYNGLKVLQKYYKKDSSIINKIIDHLDSYRIIKKVRDKCSEEEKKDSVSCTEVEVTGYEDFFGETWHKISSWFNERYNRIRTKISERKDTITDFKDKTKNGPNSSTVVTKPDNILGWFVKLLNIFGLDGEPIGYGPIVVYEREEEKKDHDNLSLGGKTPQELKDEALNVETYNSSHIVKVVEHNYKAKAVNTAINLAGLGVFAALCAQNCGIENLLGFGTPLPPLDADDAAANDAAAQADAAGDTDGDGDVDGDDGRRRDDTIVIDSYQGYNHDGNYIGYNHLKPQSQPHWDSYFKGGQDPGYAPGTFPGWYPPEINNNSDDSYSNNNNEKRYSINNGNGNNNNNNINNNRNNQNNHLIEPEEHPDFASRLGQARNIQAIHRDSIYVNLRAVVPERKQVALPQPVFRGERKLHSK